VVSHERIEVGVIDTERCCAETLRDRSARVRADGVLA
jgi:hypothetical protein